MRIGLINRSQRLKEHTNDFAKIASACTHQLIRDVAPAWERVPWAVTSFRAQEKIPDDVFPMIVMDTSDEDGALGYHANEYGRIFVNPVLDNGGSIFNSENSISAVISHEVVETFGDLFANYWVDQPDGSETPLELCDAVESDFYLIDGIAMSNFLLPSWFDSIHSRAPYDKLGKLKKPFSMSPGGYQIVRTPDNDAHAIWGEQFPEWKKALKSKKLGHSKLRFAGLQRTIQPNP